MGMVISTTIMIGVIVTGLVYIVHPPIGHEIAKRAAKVALALFAAYQILSYLWMDRIGRLLLIATVVSIVASLARGRKE
jgi:hypothetical protein